MVRQTYKYREETYAKQISDSGKFQSKHKPTELRLLALYLRGAEKTRAEIKACLETFLKNNVMGYSQLAWYKMVNRTVNYAMNKKHKLIEISTISITDGEINFIESLKLSPDYKKIMFTFLVQMRLNQEIARINGKKYSDFYFRGGIKKYGQINKISNSSKSVDINKDFVHDMAEAGHITILVNGAIRHDWMHKCVPSGDVVFEIDDFENIGLYVDLHDKSDGVRLCQDCGRPFVVSSANKRYCKDCGPGYKPVGDKRVKCVDCGLEFSIPSRGSNKIRCAYCQNNHRRMKDRIRKKKHISADHLKYNNSEGV